MSDRKPTSRPFFRGERAFGVDQLDRSDRVAQTRAGGTRRAIIRRRTIFHQWHALAVSRASSPTPFLNESKTRQGLARESDPLSPGTQVTPPVTTAYELIKYRP